MTPEEKLAIFNQNKMENFKASTRLELEDTHQELRTLLGEFGVDAHAYYLSLTEVWRKKDDIEFYRKNLDESMETVLQYVKTNYQRKVKDA